MLYLKCRVAAIVKQARSIHRAIWKPRVLLMHEETTIPVQTAKSIFRMEVNTRARSRRILLAALICTPMEESVKIRNTCRHAGN